MGHRETLTIAVAMEAASPDDFGLAQQPRQALLLSRADAKRYGEHVDVQSQPPALVVIFCQLHSIPSWSSLPGLTIRRTTIHSFTGRPPPGGRRGLREVLC